MGILDSRTLPDASLKALWDAIVVTAEIKEKLLSQAVLSFVARPKVERAKLPIHGIILLSGPPGTGKTSLARGVATRVAEALSLKNAQLVEIDPHAVAKSSLGASQRSVTDLFGLKIREAAEMGPLIVVLDEVETLAANRQKLSLETNPIDVHRATDAVLSQLDQLAEACPQLLFVATTNFPMALDEAFVSRADLVLHVELPTPEAARAILKDALGELAREWKGASHLLKDETLDAIAAEAAGLDARRIRKVVIAACASSKESSIDPGKLTQDQLRSAVRSAKRTREASP